ncbi:aminotransferase class III-fold pyridoxal phosphate-dependent enzyme [Corynebacterium argentoratense]|uniref:aminotransferase class III-fold pyridoxal phosphate-dependent enzyme n=1 Tax=Corynebacterium argentoratense TaxID=42817 RepID=UPI001F1D8816|nr:aminotransferase class III-fold pyridoxal phosphate-dependent enzyme [Corynebacterium argentoratense]
MPIPVPIGVFSFDDYEGNRYLDFSTQLVNLNLGYQHLGLIDAIKRQADTLCAIAPSFANDARSELAKMIVDAALTPPAA